MKSAKRQKNKKPFIEDIVEPAPIRSISVAKAYPQVAELWHYKLNCGFGPEDFSYGSSVQAWFKCKKDRDHIFQVCIQIATRAAKNETWSRACGFCRGYRASVTNNLADKFPLLAAEWMTKKNGIRPDQISYGSGRLVWWKCSKGHECQATLATRTSNESNCKICTVGAPTDLRDYPEELEEFDVKRKRTSIRMPCRLASRFTGFAQTIPSTNGSLVSIELPSRNVVRIAQTNKLQRTII